MTLTMQAFGPFAGRESIDFAELGEAPLFLINGPTGAGKTTILDAICYALYGTTTGAEREGAQMRCQYSPPELLTEVCLRFELNGQCYQITRLPEQARPKQRGDGTTVQKARAELYRLGEDGDTATGKLLVEQKVTDANRVVRELTGMNADQFRQVMVLPQGQFRKLLLADSQEREQIFQSLFQTGVYKQIEERLKQAAIDIRRDYEAGNNKLRGILEAGEVVDEAALDGELEQLSPQLEQQQAAYREAYDRWQQAERQLTRARHATQTRQRRRQAEAELAALLSREPEVSGKREQLRWAIAAAQLEPARRRLAECAQAEARARDEEAVAGEQLDIAGKAMESSREALAIEEAREPERSALRQSVAELESLRPLASRLGEAGREAEQGATALTRARRAESGARETLRRAAEERRALAQDIDALRLGIGAAQGVELALHRAREALANARRLADLQQTLDTAGRQLAAARARREQLAAESGGEQVALTALRRDWHLGQAWLLARQLEAGQPCPVCGSEEHPAPASTETAVPDDAALEAQETRCAEAERRLASCDRDTAALAAECEAIGQQHRALVASAGDAASHEPQALQRQVEQLQRQESQLIRDRERLQALESRVATSDNAVAAAEATLARDVEAAVAAGQALSAARARLEQIEAELPPEYRTESALAGALARQRKQLDSLDRALAEARSAHARADKQQAVAVTSAASATRRREACVAEAGATARDYEQALASSPFASDDERARAALTEARRQSLQAELEQHDRAVAETRSRLQTLERELEGEPEEDLEALTAAEQVAREQRDTALRARQSSEARRDSLLSTRDKLERQRAANSELEGRYRVVGTLADVASGQGGARISLQRYVLGVLLDDVLAQGSQRLLKMSGGRYQLIRKLDPNKGRKAAGLDLEVHDDFTGAARPVATLSGGESFMAALSLALGLSDVVQSQAGGIALDTLFVDEGFGSLDSEALELAINTLLDLQRAGRMVGIISHVSELREQMDLRIDLHAGRQGSRLDIVSPFAGGASAKAG
nr:SMC family ATPase [Parahaliea mediterranea]